MNPAAAPTPPSAIRTRPQPKCILCDSPGDILYNAMTDRVWSVPGQWDLLRCNNHRCGLVWLSPMPIEEDIGRLYADYYTHVPEKQVSDPRWTRRRRFRAAAVEGVRRGAWGYPPSGPFHGKIETLGRGVGKLFHRLNIFRDSAGPEVHWLPLVPGGSVLDVGCGSGTLLARLRDHGWHVAGVEPDPNAAQTARQTYNLDVRTGILEQQSFPSDSFDAVTIQHVIEHLPDPLRTLREVTRLLKPGGRLIVSTPNTASNGARHFGRDWFAWDSPRHLFLFSPRTLSDALRRTGFEIQRTWTSGRWAIGIWQLSQDIRATGSAPRQIPRWPRSPRDRFRECYAAIIEGAFGGVCHIGDEVVIQARKPLHD